MLAEFEMDVCNNVAGACRMRFFFFFFSFFFGGGGVADLFLEV